MTETDTGFTYPLCDWCKVGKAIVVYKGWAVVCKQCAKIREIEDDE